MTAAFYVSQLSVSCNTIVHVGGSVLSFIFCIYHVQFQWYCIKIVVAALLYPAAKVACSYHLYCLVIEAGLPFTKGYSDLLLYELFSIVAVCCCDGHIIIDCSSLRCGAVHPIQTSSSSFAACFTFARYVQHECVMQTAAALYVIASTTYVTAVLHNCFVSFPEKTRNATLF